MKISTVILPIVALQIADARAKYRREGEGEDSAAAVEGEDAEGGDDAEDAEYDEEYDIEDYDENENYEQYESSGDGFWEPLKQGIWEPFSNFLGHGRHKDTSIEEGSTQVHDWWEDFRANDYADVYDSDTEDELVTRYPIPELNEHGHVDMSELAFRDTLDEYFDIFVIILSGSILLLLACAGYGRVRNIRYMKKQYGNLESNTEEQQNLL